MMTYPPFSLKSQWDQVFNLIKALHKTLMGISSLFWLECNRVVHWLSLTYKSAFAKVTLSNRGQYSFSKVNLKRRNNFIVDGIQNRESDLFDIHNRPSINNECIIIQSDEKNITRNVDKMPKHKSTTNKQKSQSRSNAMKSIQIGSLTKE